jgi:hypothetical protein
MALIQCKECKSQVSDTAKTCPSCGAAVPKPTGRLAIFIAGVFGLIVFSSIYRSTSAPTPQAAVSTTPTAQDEYFKVVLMGAKLLKKSVKNPDSFKLNSAIRTTDGTICYEYRATNSFNAVVPGTFTVLPNRGSADEKDWIKHCYGQSGTDYTYIKSVL